MTVARAIDLTHRYGGTLTVDRVNLDVATGRVIGLLGPPGAGKTTLIKLFAGLIVPTGGTVEVNGGDPRKPRTRRRIGVALHETGFPQALRVSEVIDYVSAHHGDPCARDDLLELFDLHDVQHRRAATLNPGLKRRLAVALAFTGRPDVVFLDGPATGVDAGGRHTLWNAITAYRTDGGTVVLTGRRLSQVEAIADRVVVLDTGRVIADDGVDAIRNRHQPAARVPATFARP